VFLVEKRVLGGEKGGLKKRKYISQLGSTSRKTTPHGKEEKKRTGQRLGKGKKRAKSLNKDKDKKGPTTKRGRG